MQNIALYSFAFSVLSYRVLVERDDLKAIQKKKVSGPIFFENPCARAFIFYRNIYFFFSLIVVDKTQRNFIGNVLLSFNHLPWFYILLYNRLMPWIYGMEGRTQKTEPSTEPPKSGVNGFQNKLH